MAENENKCDVCGGTEFDIQEGFYYCGECGTQSQHIRDFQVDQAGIEDSQIFFTAQKIRKDKTKQDKLTTWECFNYLLRGLVEELLSLGAKEELKLTVLQLWTAYLRANEVAFFSTRNVELPRLGPKFSERDARILYNHKKPPKKRVSNKSEGSESEASGKRKKWEKKEYAKAEYAHLSSEGGSSIPISVSQNSSSSAASNRAIRLNLSRKARKYYKRYMPSKHLDKHEMDSNYELNCHTLHSNKFRGANVGFERLSRRTIYAIVYLALNLIEDDIQLCDLLRFCREGHLSTYKFTQFLPSDDVARECSEVIKLSCHFGTNLVFRNKMLRTTANNLARLIRIPELKLPNLVKMAKRFITDLSLPEEIGCYVERLYNFHPPNMKSKITTHFANHNLTPCYEGRAMAYVVFVLKLLFLLDGESELNISNSAKTINAELRRLGHEDKLIFVWEDWVEYIEMRKIILTQLHFPTSSYLGQNVNYDQHIDHLRQVYEKPEEVETKPIRNTALAMEKIFQNLHNKLLKESGHEQTPTMKFQPSFTPYRSYLSQILSEHEHFDKVVVPEFMLTDPSKADIKPFIDCKELKALFHGNGVNLHVKKIECTKLRRSIGIFRSFNRREKNRKGSMCRFRVVDHDITEDEWRRNVKADKVITDVFSGAQDTFKRPTNPNTVNVPKTDLRQVLIDNALRTVADIDTRSIRSFEIFNEDNMDPLPANFIGDTPRQIETESVFENLGDDDDHDGNNSNTITDHANDFEKTVELLVSNFDCWILLGTAAELIIEEKQKVEQKLPSGFHWLLRTCAEMIEVDVIDLYTELLAIESEFCYALEPLENSQGTLLYRNLKRDRGIENVVSVYKNVW